MVTEARSALSGNANAGAAPVQAHGSATAGRESFDLQVAAHPSVSLMDFLAQQGFDAFAPDVRGFGRSTLPETHLTTEQATERRGRLCA